MKRHLARQSVPPIRRGACGLENPVRWTHDPAEVTCTRCRTTLRMADAEIEKQQKINRRSHRVNRTGATS